MNDEVDGTTASKDESVYELLNASDLSPALKRTIQDKLDRGELDEVDAGLFKDNLRKTLKNK